MIPWSALLKSPLTRNLLAPQSGRSGGSSRALGGSRGFGGASEGLQSQGVVNNPGGWGAATGWDTWGPAGMWSTPDWAGSGQSGQQQGAGKGGQNPGIEMSANLPAQSKGWGW